MTAVIEIANGLVSLTERTVSHQIPLADWMDKIEKRNPLYTPVLPAGTRALYWDQTDLADQKLLVLMEQEPQVVRLDFMHEIKVLSMPWTRFMFYLSTNDPTNVLAWHMADYRVFWSKTSYTDPAKSDMIRALVPNVYGDGRICFGGTAADMEQSLSDRLQQTVNEFYVSRFNRDLQIVRPNGWRNWSSWERMTQRDPTGWMNWPDFDPSQATHSFFSFESVAAGVRYGGLSLQQARLAPMVAAEPIPEVPLGATFGRLTEWIDTLEDSQRDRLLQAMLRDRALNNERYMTPATEDEDGMVIEQINLTGTVV